VNKPEKLAAPRVRAEADGTFSVTTGKVDIGQGISTALAQIAAEELEVDFSRIRMLPPSTDESPDEGVTSGSLSIQDGGKSLRAACAAFRGSPEKSPREYRVVGTSVPRLDLSAKFAGRASYLQDMKLPGMLHGRMVRPFFPYKKLLSLEVPNGIRVVRDGSFLGVLAETEAEAIEAQKKVRARAKWEPRPEAPADWASWLKAHVDQDIVCKETKDDAARSRGAKTLKARYTKPLIAHASIGPSCAIAQWKGGKLEVWSHSQGIYNLRKELALVLRMGEADIVVRHAEGAGCYGHNGADDVALDAALLARQAGGRPVRLQWMRDDEFAWEPYGPAALLELEASLDAQGAIVSWRHDFWSNGCTHRPGRLDQPTLWAAEQIAAPMERAPATNPPLPAGGSDRNALPGYEFPDLRVMNHYVKAMPVRGSSLRSLGAFANVFAIESFMDELALAAGFDPVSFRLKHLKDPRAIAVIEKIAPQFRKGAGHGIAYAKYKNLGAYCAVLAEVEASGAELRCKRLVAAVDVGLPVNPDGVVNQIEGGLIQAASWTLKEAVKPGALGWEDYPILKFTEVPSVEVILLKNQFNSVGAGECTMGPVAAAIANALHDALGVRARDLPLTPENIAKAINA
jgi:CO/xanthine dehydrogenase Mo-binding subunit